MNQMLGVSTLAYDSYGLQVALRELSRLGVRCIEPAFVPTYSQDAESWDFSPRAARLLRDLLSDHGQCALAISAHLDLGSESVLPAFRQRMEFAHELGAGIVNTNACRKSDEASFMKNIERLAGYAQTLGLVIALENPGPGYGEDNILSSGQAGASLVQRIGSESVRLNYDTGNVLCLSRGKLLPQEDIQHVLPFVSHIHLKDPKQDSSGWSYGDAIGDGAVDYQAVFQVLSQAKEQPPISIELPLKMRLTADFTPYLETLPPELAAITRTVERSLEFVRRLLLHTTGAYPEATKDSEQ